MDIGQVYILDLQGGFLRFWQNRLKMSTEYAGTLLACVQGYIWGYMDIGQGYILDFQGGFFHFWQNRLKMPAEYTGTLQVCVQGYIWGYMKWT